MQYIYLNVVISVVCRPPAFTLSTAESAKWLTLSSLVSPPGNCPKLKTTILSNIRPPPRGSMHLVTSYHGVKFWLTCPNLLIFCRDLEVPAVQRDQLRPFLCLRQSTPSFHFSSILLPSCPQSFWSWDHSTINFLPAPLPQGLFPKESDLWLWQRT